MTELSALLLVYAGCTALALSQNQHQRASLGKISPERVRWRLRSAGGAGLILGLLACLERWSLPTSLVLWTGVFTVSALLAALALTYRARLVPRSCAASAAAGLALWFF
jgi:hypothetical protein